VKALAGRYEMIVVFDASIRPILKMSEGEIAREVGDAATVHVVPTRTKADETVLAVAKGDHAYVVSNDRFVDFQEKVPVREGRIIRHEIVDGRVLIHDLDVDVTFTGPDPA
jgi:hypothetical protein